MNDQMMRVISSPSSSTTGFLTWIFATGGRCYLPGALGRTAAATAWRWHNRYPMATRERQTFGNHAVANQPPPLVDYNVFDADRPLVEAVRREGAEWAEGGSPPSAPTPAAPRAAGARPPRQRERRRS